MTERAWLVRDAIRRVLTDAPAPPATWPSVVRRTLVVVVFFGYGIAADNLSWAILACFGAVQIGLMEAALPFRGLIRLVVPLVLACTIAVAISMLVADTWAGVLYITALSYVFGCTAGLGARSMTIGISALALSVIFSGTDRPYSEIPESLAWVVLGMVVQAVLWIAVWRTERRWFVRRAIASKLRAIVLMMRSQTVDPEALVRMHNQSDVALEDLYVAAFGPEERERMVAAYLSSMLVARAVTSWMVIDQPGDEARIRVGIQITQQAHRLDGFFGRNAHPKPLPGVARTEVEESLATLDASVTSVLTGSSPPTLPPISLPDPPQPAAATFWGAMRPGTHTSRDGLRMALGVGVAEAITVLYAGSHSFWLALTVVFVLRPSWSLTVVRGINRTIGNLGALLLLPFVFISLGAASWALAIVLAILAAVTYRWFFGNYVIACFGLAGTILLLDYSLNPDPDLFVTRFVATILGSLIALAAILAIPGWRRHVAPEQARALISSLQSWREHARRLLTEPESRADESLEPELREARHRLLVLEPTTIGVLLEPSDRGKPVRLATLFAAGSRAVAALMGVTYCLLAAEHHARALTAEERTRLLTRSNVEGAWEDFDRAARAYLA